MPEAEPFNPHENKTLDGHLVVEGMWVWDYNLRVSQVQYDLDATKTTGYCPAHCRDDHWFQTSGGMFNGGRMWVAHPRTRQLAKDAVLS